MVWHAKEVVREIYTINDPELTAAFVKRLGVDLQDRKCPPEVPQLRWSIVKWYAPISACHVPGFRTGLPKRRTT